jgi:hypothetical protein
MKLWVDDLRDPAARNDEGELIFLESWEDPANWIWAKTITEAIRILATIPIEHVSLDHDICHPINSGIIAHSIACLEDYTPVARYIAAMCVDERPKQVDVHTANGAGAKSLGSILRDGGVEKIRRRNL